MEAVGNLWLRSIGLSLHGHPFELLKVDASAGLNSLKDLDALGQFLDLALEGIEFGFDGQGACVGHKELGLLGIPDVGFGSVPLN